MPQDERTRAAQRVTWVGFYINFALSAVKIIAGIFGKSTAMIADGIHSLSDFITDMIVVFFIGISGKERDHDHKYGHGKYETFATMLISVALVIVAIGIFWSGASKIFDVMNGVELEQPSIMALVAALGSIFVKEGLYWYTRKVGLRIESSVVIANAWHHRSDAFSSIGTALGIAGAIFLSEKWRVLDPIAGVVVSIFIFKVAFDLGMPSIHELLEKALPNETEAEIELIIELEKDIVNYHNLKTRKIGNVYAIDVHIRIDEDTSFVRTHDIATELEKKLRKRFGKQTITNIHTEPINVK
jgi:cation diffusion facilitator family transporter